MGPRTEHSAADKYRWYWKNYSRPVTIILTFLLFLAYMSHYLLILSFCSLHDSKYIPVCLSLLNAINFFFFKSAHSSGLLKLQEVFAWEHGTIKWLCIMKLCKVILIINGENGNCLMTFKILCQNIQTSITDRYKCIKEWKMVKVIFIYYTVI